jgi:hypothetical protein
MELGGGIICLLWEDRWIKGNGVDMIMPLLLDFVDVKKISHGCTVAQGITNNAWVDNLSTGLNCPSSQFLEL